MRRWNWILLALFSLGLLLLSAGCPKKTVKDTPDQGEEQPGDPTPKPGPIVQ